MSSKWFVAVAIALVALTLWAVGLSNGVGPQPEAMEAPDCKGKVLAIIAKDSVRGVWLQNTQVKRLGGRAFLTGAPARLTDTKPVSDAISWLPVEHVLAITEYKSLEDTRKAASMLGVANL